MAKPNRIPTEPEPLSLFDVFEIEPMCKLIADSAATTLRARLMRAYRAHLGVEYLAGDYPSDAEMATLITWTPELLASIISELGRNTAQVVLAQEFDLKDFT